MAKRSALAGRQPRHKLDAANSIVEANRWKEDGAMIHAVDMQPTGMQEHQRAKGCPECTQRSAVGQRRPAARLYTSMHIFGKKTAPLHVHTI